MAKRWSKLQSRLYQLIDPTINFQIHCALYEMNSNDGHHGSKLPRYFITIDKEIIFDYPKNFDTTKNYGFNSYPWDTDISEISEIIEQYIQCSDSELMNRFEDDKWGLTDILRVCDRRIGKRRLQELRDVTTHETLLQIINKRLQVNIHDCREYIKYAPQYHAHKFSYSDEFDFSEDIIISGLNKIMNTNIYFGETKVKVKSIQDLSLYYAFGIGYSGGYVMKLSYLDLNSLQIKIYGEHWTESVKKYRKNWYDAIVASGFQEEFARKWVYEQAYCELSDVIEGDYDKFKK